MGTGIQTAFYLSSRRNRSANRYWTIAVDCSEAGDDPAKTKAKITYSFFALNKTGVKLNKNRLDKMYKNDLKDREEAINEYLSKQ